jgi:hypothetical protein
MVSDKRLRYYDCPECEEGNTIMYRIYLYDGILCLCDECRKRLIKLLIEGESEIVL